MKKIKVLLAFALCVTFGAAAQGYTDGIEYYKAGQYDNAITLLERNMSTAADKALAQYYLGQAYLAKNEVAKAKAAFDAGMAADAENPYNYVGLGSLQLRDGNVAAAKDLFKKAQSLAKKNTEVTVDIARAYYNANPETYAKEIDEAIKKARKDSKNREPSIYIFEGDRYAKNEQWNDAATSYEQAILFDEDNPEGYVKYSNVYFYIQPEYAISKLDELLKKRPNSALAQRQLAEKYYESGKWTRAAQEYGKYIQNPNHFQEDKARYAVLLYAGQNYNDAIKVSKEVLSFDPENFQTQRVMMRSFADLKDYPAAIEAGKKFFGTPAFQGRFNSSDYTTMYNLLKADSTTRQEALSYLENGLKAIPKDPNILYELSDYWFDQKDYPKAADFIEQYVDAEENPSRSDMYGAALNFLGAVSAVRADSVARKSYGDRGIKMIDRAMEGLELSETPAPYLRRKALIATIANNNITDDLAKTTWEQMIQRLDMDPENANPANEKNRLSYYVDGYRGIAQYYADKNDNENMNAAKAKMEYYQGLENGSVQK